MPAAASSAAVAAAAAVTCLRNAYGTLLSSNGRGNIYRVRGRTHQALFYRLADLVCYGVIGDMAVGNSQGFEISI